MIINLQAFLCWFIKYFLLLIIFNLLIIKIFSYTYAISYKKKLFNKIILQNFYQSDTAK